MSKIILEEQASPSTPSAANVALYPKSDGLLYSMDDAGTESIVTAASATQAQMENGTSTNVFVSPGRQQYHESAAKGWAKAAMDGSATISYNVTSITDGGTGIVSANWATDFSGTNHADFIGVVYTPGGAAGTTRIGHIVNDANAGYTSANIVDGNWGLNDPTYVMFVAYGDQA